MKQVFAHLSFIVIEMRKSGLSVTFLSLNLRSHLVIVFRLIDRMLVPVSKVVMTYFFLVLQLPLFLICIRNYLAQ